MRRFIDLMGMSRQQIALTCNRCGTHIVDHFYAHFITMNGVIDTYKVKSHYVHNLTYDLDIGVLHCIDCGQYLGLFIGSYCYLNPQSLNE